MSTLHSVLDKVYKTRKVENNINGTFFFSKKGIMAFFSINDNH